MNNSERLDYIIKKLDQYDVYFQEIRSDIVELKSDIVELKSDIVELKSDIVELKSKVSKLDKDFINLSKQVKDLNDYRMRNNNSIEIEITKAVYKILKETEKSLYIINVSSIFPKKYKNDSMSVFIEIDGLILGTNDRDYASIYDKSLKPIKLSKNQKKSYNISNNLSEKVYKLYIIEGKHNITYNKVVDKYSKFIKFKKFLDDIHNNIDIFDKKTINYIKKYQLDKFKSSDVVLIFGTPMWNQRAKEKITEYMKGKDDIRIIILSGNRYDMNNNFI